MNAVILHLMDSLDRVKACSLSYPKAPPWFIRFDSQEWSEQTFAADDLFDCLLLLRKFLEGKGWLILCNGARVDAYPSTLSREMSGGKKIYVIKMGERAKPENLVYIFDEAPPEKVGTIEEQSNYYKQWINSINQNSVR